MYTIYFYTFDRPLPGCVVCVQQCKLFLLAFFFLLFDADCYSFLYMILFIGDTILTACCCTDFVF